jgi:hypothetical protein
MQRCIGNLKEIEPTHVCAGVTATVNIDTERQRHFSDVVLVLFEYTATIAVGTQRSPVK